MYKVGLDPRAGADLVQLDGSVRVQVIRSLRAKLTSHPDVYGKPLRHPLARLWSLRVGEYRVVYRLQKELVLVVFIGLRDSAYAEVQKRIS